MSPVLSILARHFLCASLQIAIFATCGGLTWAPPVRAAEEPAARPCTLMIHLPSGAELLLDGVSMKSTNSTVRKVVSPPLVPGKKYSYEVTIRWTAGGKEHTLAKKVQVEPGRTHEIRFVTAAAEGDVTPAEQAIIDATNRHRAAAGLPMLVANPRLMQAARGHSANMAQQQRMSHTLDGKQFDQRIRETGYSLGAAGENVAEGATSSEDAVNMWMNSPGHRANILTGSYREIGVGIGAGANGRQYYTQVFASPR